MSFILNLASVICGIIAAFHCLAAAIVVWIFMPVGLGLLFIGVMFLVIAIVLSKAADKARIKEEEQKEKERG